MCGRFAQNFSPVDLVELFDLLGVPDTWESHYNLAPTRSVAAVRAAPLPAPPPPASATSTATANAPAGRELVFLHWGLIPHWAQDRNIGAKLFNARSETAAEKPSFRAAFRQRRCLIPANCFYEWRVQGKTKTPMLICRRDHRPLALAGLWERWSDPDGGAVESCSILTTAANEFLKPIHHRMPVILEPDQFADWLAAATAPAQVQELCRPCAPELLEAYAVTNRVNDARRDEAACMQPASPGDPLTHPEPPAADDSQGRLF